MPSSSQDQEQFKQRRAADLAELILDRKSEILFEWERAVRELPSARDLPQPVILDSVPELLQAIAHGIAGVDDEVPRDLADLHALHRLDRGFDVAEAVREYTLLRDVILRLWERATTPASRGSARVLHRSIDGAISCCVERFIEAQDRTASAVDGIATASLESEDLDALLRRLLTVVLRTLPAVDTAAVLLREGDCLRVRAAVGLEREAEIGFSVRMGEGFAGTIAAERRPLLLRDARQEPNLRSKVLRERGVRALYGVPMIEAGEVIGVAHVGSTTAHDLSDQDRRILELLANRASAAVYQHLLRRDTEKRAAELAAIIEHIPEGVYIANTTGIERVNRRALELVGAASVEDLHVRYDLLLERLHARDPDTGAPIALHESGFGRALRGERTIREVAITLPDGTERILRTSFGPIPAEGAIEMAVAISSDVTDARRQERERATLLAREQEAVRLRDQVLAVVSHDLRNPLGAIHMAASLIGRRARDAGEAPMIHQSEVIQRSVSRMERMIGDLLDMASIQAGKLNVVRRRERADLLLLEAVELQEPLARERGVELVADPRIDGVEVECDRERILQVFGNLIGNALKFSAGSGQGDKVVVWGALEGADIRFEITDTGPGISAEHVERVFLPYWTAGGAGKKGTGLGLFITKGIVEAHGGRVWVVSEVGRGTTMHFTLPVAASRVGPSAPRATSAQAPKSKHQ